MRRMGTSPERWYIHVGPEGFDWPTNSLWRRGGEAVTIEVQGLDPDRMVVLSLKPRFAEAILVGDKTVELRRTMPKIVVPTRALLYAATPMRALLGTCIVTDVASADLAVQWREYGSRTGLLFHEFQHYFEGVDAGAALTLAHPQPFSRKIPLEDLRATPRGFRPPQSFAYVDAETGSRLMGRRSSSARRSSQSWSRSPKIVSRSCV